MMKEKPSETFKIKILSVLVAFGMWIFVMEKIDPIIIRSLEDVQIKQITNMKEIEEQGLVLTYNQPLAVKVDLRARRSTLLNYIRITPEIKAKIENPSVGANMVTLTLDTPSGVEYSFEPKNFKINLEEGVIAEKSVDIVLEGTPKENFAVSEININKQKVYVEGAKSQVDKVANLQGTLSIEGASKDFSLKTKIAPVDAKGSLVDGVKIDTEYVIVDVRMEESKEVPVRIRLFDSFDQEVKNTGLMPSIENILITGKSEKIAKVDEIVTQKIAVSAYNQKPELEFDLQIPEGIRVSNKKIQLKVVEEEQMEYTFEIPSSEVAFTGAIKTEEIKQGLPPFISISFKASKEYEDLISTDSIKISIDNSAEQKEYPFIIKMEYPINSFAASPNHITVNEGE